MIPETSQQTSGTSVEGRMVGHNSNDATPGPSIDPTPGTSRESNPGKTDLHLYFI